MQKEYEFVVKVSLNKPCTKSYALRAFKDNVYGKIDLNPNLYSKSQDEEVIDACPDTITIKTIK